MKLKTLLLASAILLTAPSAFAVQDNSAAVSSSNNDVNQITGNGNVLSTGSGAFGSAASVTNSNTTTGGTGGSATANGGAGGSVIGSGNSTATGGTVRDSGNSVSVATGGTARGGDARSTQNATTGNQSVNVTNKRNPVSTAFAGSLVAADDTCMGSSSAGAQGIGFGVSLGSTWTDEDCVRRKDARELHNMNRPDAALALMCQKESVRKAMATAGTPCTNAAEVASSEVETVERSAYPSNGSRNR